MNASSRIKSGLCSKMNQQNEKNSGDWNPISAQDVIEKMPVGVVIINSEGEILRVNNSALLMFGYENSEMVGKKIQNLVFEGNKEFEKFLDEELKTGASKKNIEFTGFSKGGEEVLLLTNSTSVRKANSNLFLLTFQDITERKEDLENLREKKKFLDALMVSSPDQIYFKDRKHRFILLNEATAENLGATVEEAIGKTDFDFFPEELAQDYYEDEEKVMKTGEPLINKEEITGPEEKERWNFSTKVPIFDEDGKVVGVAGINRDITQRVKAKEEVAGLEAKIRASLKNSDSEIPPPKDE